ncbi:unnamed protein product [Camellia sinensis]
MPRESRVVVADEAVGGGAEGESEAEEVVEEATGGAVLAADVGGGRGIPCFRGDNSSIALTVEISSLVQNLSSRELDIQREAIVKIRMLSKENPDNRILLANMGAIPPLIKL